MLSTPAIDHLRREAGAENVLVLTSPGLGQIFGEAVLVYEVGANLTEQDMADHLRAFAPSMVFVFSEKKRALKAAQLTGASQTIGFDPGWSQPLRSIAVKRVLTKRLATVNSLQAASRYHEVERYCQLVGKGLSRKLINGGCLRFYGAEPDAEKRVTSSGPIGFQWTRKWLKGGWPEETLLKLVDLLPSSARVFVSPEEENWARSLLVKDRLDALVCERDLVCYARALATCRYLVSIDTGAVHVAAAVGTPVVAVFPGERADHTVPRWRPWMVPHQVALKPCFGPGSVEDLLRRVAKASQDLEAILAWCAVRYPRF